MPAGVTPARAAARDLVSAARVRQAWGHELLGETLERHRLAGRDIAFATRLGYGVLACEGTLDEAVDRYLMRPTRVHPAVRDVLRIAAYELLFMRTPHRVAVHQAVEAVRAVAPHATGMTNAVLRKLARDADGFPWGDPSVDVEALARSVAHPRWLVERVLNDLGPDDARAFLAANNEPAPLYLAHNPFAGELSELLSRLADDGAEPSQYGPPGCIVAGVPAAAVRSHVLQDGTAIVADAVAQYVASLAAQRSGAHVIELAAGRGTKTLLIQAASLRAGGTGTVGAADVHDFKVRLLEERMRFLRVPHVTGVVADTTDRSCIDVLGGPSSADVVMVDAPCSGLGTLRRHPEKRWRLDPSAIDRLADVAASMLRTAGLLVRPGGFVVYSTCTVTRRENQTVLEGFLAGEGERFRTMPPGDDLPAGWQRFVTSEGWFASRPEPDGPDGHFAAVLTRT